MSDTHFSATYRIETPFELHKVAAILAGEQSCGTFARVAGETDDLRARAAAEVVEVRDCGEVPASLPSAYLTRHGVDRPVRAAEIRIRFPISNVGPNLATLAATVAGNLFDLGETTGVRLESVRLPAGFRDEFLRPVMGVAGTRAAVGVPERAMIGSIIKPNVGLSCDATADVVRALCAAGIDFIKDDEISGNPRHAPLTERIRAVMTVIRDHADRTGKQVMVAFNITDETDAMRRHADLVRAEGGSCVMASANWCGFSAMETLRKSTDLAIHAHRNGYGAFSRHPALGIGIGAYQTLWRLSGIDHFHVHGLQGKFAQDDSEVIAGARDSLTTMGAADDRVVPAFSSGQWAGTVPATYRATGTTDLLFLAGGGIMAHPDGPAAGVASLQDAWAATAAGIDLEVARRSSRPLAAALDFFGGKD